MFPVLDRDVEWMPTSVEICDNRLPGPVAIVIDDVATVTSVEQLGIEMCVGGPWQRVWANSDFRFGVFLEVSTHLRLLEVEILVSAYGREKAPVLTTTTQAQTATFWAISRAAGMA